MKQSILDLSNTVKRTRKRQCLDAMEQVGREPRWRRADKSYAAQRARQRRGALPYRSCCPSTACRRESGFRPLPWKKRRPMCLLFLTCSVWRHLESERRT